MDIGVATLSEVQRPDCGEIMVGGYTYYWSGRSDGYHAQGVAVAVSNKLTPMIIEVTPVNERIMPVNEVTPVTPVNEVNKGFVTPWVSFPWSLYLLRLRWAISP